MRSRERVAREEEVSVEAEDAPAPFYLPGRSYDEMFAADGAVRAHYAAMHTRMTTLEPAELANRQRTLEQSFLPAKPLLSRPARGCGR